MVKPHEYCDGILQQIILAMWQSSDADSNTLNAK